MILLAAVPLSALITAGVVRALGVSRRTAVWTTIAATVATIVAVVAVFFTFLFECASDGGSGPEAWPWSPREELCDGESSPVALGMLALLFIPTALVLLGTWLRVRGRRTLGWFAYAGLLATPALSGLYVAALPVYEVDSYPILHEPMLRPAGGSEPARVCYVYGIVGEAEISPATMRHCIELEPTARARRLTTRYDEGETVFDLERVGENLTQEGLPVEPGETGVAGLDVARAYRLREEQARIGARELD